MNQEILDESEQFQDDNSPHFNKPNFMIRIKSMLVDSVSLIVLMMIASFLLNTLHIESGNIRGFFLVAIVFYEPIFITTGRTIGQRVMGLKVVNFGQFKNDRKEQSINIFASLFRYAIKILLGWISLLTIHSDPYGQAIHDKIANSVVVYNNR
jgi:uncharacterized RDD family membrane protein YckC